MTDNVLKFPDSVFLLWRDIYEPRLRETLAASSVAPAVIDQVIEKQRQIFFTAAQPIPRIENASVDDGLRALNEYVFMLTWNFLWEIGVLNAKLLQAETR